MKKDIKWKYLLIAVVLSLLSFSIWGVGWVLIGPAAIFLGLFIASIITKFLTSSNKDSSKEQYMIGRKLGRKVLFSLSAFSFLLFASQYVLPYAPTGYSFLFFLFLWLFALPLGVMLCIAGFKSKKSTSAQSSPIL